MNSETEKLGRFSRAVYKLADTQADKIMAEAYADHDRDIQQAGNDGLALSYEKIKEQVREINEKYVRLIAKGELDAKRRVLLCREELAERVFSRVEEMLQRYLHSKDYENYLFTAAKNAAKKFPRDVGEIFLRQDDMKFGAELLQALPDGYSVTEDRENTLGGMCICYKERNLLLDYTFQTALEKEKENFRASQALKLE